MNVKEIMGQNLGSFGRRALKPRAVLVALATTLGIALCARPNLAAPATKGVGPDGPARDAVARDLPGLETSVGPQPRPLVDTDALEGLLPGPGLPQRE